MADNNVLFATLLALIASLIACVEINFAILTTTIYYFLRRILNFIQIVGSNNTKKQFRDEGVYNVFVLNLAKDDFRFVQGKQMPGGTTQGQVQAIVLDIQCSYNKIRNSHRGLGLRGLETRGCSRVALCTRMRNSAIAFSCRLLIPNRIRVEANIKCVVSAYPDALGLGLNRSLKKR